MDRRKTGDIIWLALQYAKRDREAFIDAWGNNIEEPVVKDAMGDIQAFERLQLRLFGTTKSQLEAKMDKMKVVSVFNLRKILEEYLENK